jgi:phospholipase C
MRTTHRGLFAVTLFAVASLIGWAGCSQNAGTGLTPPTTADRSGPKKRAKRAGEFSAITHIFIIVQENRSLNQLFAGANIVGADTTTTGEELTSSGVEQPIALKPEPFATQMDIDHCYYDAATAINFQGNGVAPPMDGFNYESTGGCGPGPTAGPNPYAYVEPGSEIETYWALARNWVLASQFFPTELGPSFVAHLNIVAGTTEVEPGDAIADFPHGSWGCLNQTKDTVRNFGPSTPYATPGPYKYGPPCYDQFHTIADILDCIYCKTSTGFTAVPWRYYAPTISGTGSKGGGIWSAFQAIKRVYHGGSGGDWSKDVISPDYQIFSDITASNLDKVGVTWVVPEFKWSDHAGNGTSSSKASDWGPSWVGDIVNAIGGSKYWKNSVIVVLWDDWGGWYDPAPPPMLDFGSTSLGYGRRGYGIRTPMLIISPYDPSPPNVAAGHVFSTERLEPGSILKFIEQVFFNGKTTLGSLPCKGSYYYYGCGLGYTDGTDPATNSIGDVLNMSQSPMPYVPVTTVYPPSKFENSYYYYNPGPVPDDE